LRADEDFAGSVSTVASPLPAAESITALWAVAAAFHATVGAYGVDDAESALPPYRPAPLEPPEAADKPGQDPGQDPVEEPDQGSSPASAEPVAAKTDPTRLPQVIAGQAVVSSGALPAPAATPGGVRSQAEAIATGPTSGQTGLTRPAPAESGRARLRVAV
jgi:hypothetical protein